MLNYIWFWLFKGLFSNVPVYVLDPNVEQRDFLMQVNVPESGNAGG